VLTRSVDDTHVCATANIWDGIITGQATCVTVVILNQESGVTQGDTVATMSCQQAPQSSVS
jgi:hypothetical protein